LEHGHVRMYVCGPTVYDSSHLGHARSAVVFDVVFRYLVAVGYKVTYVRNFTDVDDKIIKRAGELGTDTATVARRYMREFHEDMDALGVRRATVEPLATEHIGQIIGIVERLVEKGCAYEMDGDVYFSVDTYEGYGKLSGRKLDEMEAGARVEVNERKRNPFDFVLWKGAKPGEPMWDSPWGKGRPGWHIECSAMSREHLGETFDIHGGGMDLIFPHHENEVAQSEAAFGKPLAVYWMHNGFVNINQEKMSKSLGNFLTVREILKTYHPEAVRLFLLSKHYRSPIDFTPEALQEATAALDRAYNVLLRMETTLEERPEPETATGNFWKRFCESMDDDFNTAQALGVLFEAVRHGNRMLDGATGFRAGKEAAQGRGEILSMGAVLGLFGEPPAHYFEHKTSQAVGDAAIDVGEVERLVAQRTEARKARDWKAADAIRDRLASMGIRVEDAGGGTVWKKA